MKTNLMEVDVKNYTLTTVKGKVYSVEPWDIVICAPWPATSEIEISTKRGQKYCTLLSNGQTIRLKDKV